MTTPFDLLGIPDDADEREIKRAYARKLKITRPDDDAEAFQALHFAYNSALQLARAKADAADACPSPPSSHEECPDEPSPDGGTEHAAPIPSTLMVEAQDQHQNATGGPQFSFNLDHFLDTLKEKIALRDDAALADWLSTTTKDWPIFLPHIVSDPILGWIVTEQPDISLGSFDLLISTFAADDVFTSRSPIEIETFRRHLEYKEELHRRQHRLGSLLSKDNRRALATYMSFKENGDYGSHTTFFYMYLLTNPRSSLLIKVLSRYSLTRSRIVRFISLLDQGRVDALPPVIPQNRIDLFTGKQSDYTSFTIFMMMVMAIIIRTLVIANTG